MPSFEVLEPAIDPNNKIGFLLDWELTLKCNLDCSYCHEGLYGGHDNSTSHPPLDECLKSIDFMYEYVDLYMQTKPKGIRYVILNVYGGEALHHPNIVEILQTCRNKYNEKYKDRWHLTITTTTNVILSDKLLSKVIPYIDEFTCSFHTEASDKQKEQFKRNALEITKQQKRLKCVILMHSIPELFEEAKHMIQWCTDNNIKHLPRQLDHTKNSEFNYNSQQVQWFDSLYTKKSYQTTSKVLLKTVDEQTDMAESGRACCGGRQLCQDQNQKSRHFFVENKFTDWHCSVNEFFLFVKQVTKEIFVNKDCKMNFSGEVAPIGTLDNYQTLLDNTNANLKNNSMPIIQCKRDTCFCGLCAPKAKSLETYNSIMEKYRI